MNAGIIVYCAELEEPRLRKTACGILQAEAAQFGVSLERADVTRRRAQGGATIHAVAAAEELVRRLASIETDSLGEPSPLMVLARAGARALMSTLEEAGNRQAPPSHR
jgi:hypothetical protein